MASIRRKDVPPGPIRDLFDRLNELHFRAGEPSVREIVEGIGKGAISTSTVYNSLAGPKVPKWGFLELIVERLNGSAEEFRELWQAARLAEKDNGNRTGTEKPPEAETETAGSGNPVGGASIPLPPTTAPA
ncbi:hypothetical protein ACFQ07_18790, partial [Actinomadura adrarensis]